MKKIIIIISLLISSVLLSNEVKKTVSLKEINHIRNFEVTNKGYAYIQKNIYKVNKIVLCSKKEYAEVLFYEKKYKIFNIVVKTDVESVCNIYLKTKKI